MFTALRLLHIVSAFAGVAGFAAVLGIAELRPAPGASGELALAWVGSRVLQPALLAMVVTGLLLIALRPAYIGQRWVWAKGLLAMTAIGLTAIGLRSQAGAAAALGCALAAVVLAVWRPRFGRG